MRTIVTGTVGLDRLSYLQKLERITRAAGEELTVCHVGQRMYAEAPDVAPGRILDLPISRLSSLRRSVFKDILAVAQRSGNLIVNTHATFRWKHGLFPAFDFDQLAQLQPDLYICLLDNVDCLHARLDQDHTVDHSLKDLLVWREEETLATELMMLGSSMARHGNLMDSQADNAPPLPARFYTLALGNNCSTVETFFRLMYRSHLPRAYLSYPMTHVTHLPGILDEINHFRRAIFEKMIVFDPGDLEEQELYVQALAASEAGQKTMERDVLGRPLRFDVAEIMQVAGDIHAQIYARDFMLIDQADMIISYVPELPDGQPGLSSGVERELQHAHEAAKEVYVIWRPQTPPSPFVTETATQVFPSLQHASASFERLGYIKPNGPAPETLFPV